jgi:hypothetical protein
MIVGDTSQQEFELVLHNRGKQAGHNKLVTSDMEKDVPIEQCC